MNSAQKSIMLETPVGVFTMLLNTDSYVTASGFTNSETLATRHEVTLRATSTLTEHAYINLVRRYFNGDKNALSAIPVLQQGGVFQQSIYRKLSEVPFGTTLSYKQLADSVDSHAVRAAGTACGKNRLVLLIPCHRIIRTDGNIGQYAYGPDIKKSLIDFERSQS